ncbi:hypothetical protein GCM10027085_27600 [Spirosoma aerophilum]
MILTTCLLVACGQSEKAKDQSTQRQPDTTAAKTPQPKDCQTVDTGAKLGKADVYQESAKPIKVSITIEQDTSSTVLDNGCYFNNSITVMATKKAGGQVFKRTLLKDDLLYFVKSDKDIEKAVLQSATYKPTFNSLKFITFTMHLIDPTSRQTLDYLVTMNYFGEIIKVK